MPLPPPDGYVLVYAPHADNAGTIARRLRAGGLECHVAADPGALEQMLTDHSDRIGAVVVTELGARRGAGAVIARFRQAEPAWSALPVVLLAKPSASALPLWGHTTLVTQPTTSQQLVDVLARAVESRSHQHMLAARSLDLHRAAFRDALTGLPNRSALYEKIRELQAERRGTSGAFAALFVDLDGFKAINDTYGHRVGDEALRQVGASLVAAVRGSDYVSRWGGDEFMILLIGPTDAERVAETIGRLGHGVDLQLHSAAESIRLAFSVGLIDDIPSEATPDEVVGRADERMYEHKRRWRKGDPG